MELRAIDVLLSVFIRRVLIRTENEVDYNEVKTPKKPVINFDWCIDGTFVHQYFSETVYIQKMQAQDVKYSTFISQTEKSR